MTIQESERKSVWLAVASAAVAGLVRPNEEGETMDSDDVCTEAEELADMMLESYEERFGGRKKRPPKSKRARNEDDEEEEGD